MSPLVILLPRKGYLQHFGSKIAKIVSCYYHDLGQSERNIFDFSLCVQYLGINSLETTYILFKFPYSRLQGGERGKGRRSTRGLLLLIELSFGAWNSCAIVVQRQLPAKSPQYQRNNNCEIAITFESFDFKRFYKGFFLSKRSKKLQLGYIVILPSFCFMLTVLARLDQLNSKAYIYF